MTSWTRGCGRWRPNAPAPTPARARTRPRINLIDLAEMVDAITEDEEED